MITQSKVETSSTLFSIKVKPKPIPALSEPCYLLGTVSCQKARETLSVHRLTSYQFPPSPWLQRGAPSTGSRQSERQMNSKGAHVPLLHTVPTWRCQRCGTLMDVAAAWFPGPIWTYVSPQCDRSMKQLMLLMVQEVTRREPGSPPALGSVFDPSGRVTMAQHCILSSFF